MCDARKSLCVLESERERESVCVCVCEREREREREREKVKERLSTTKETIVDTVGFI